MKKFIVLVLLGGLSLYANNEELISKDLVKSELTKILKNVKKYKEKNDNTKQKLLEKLNALEQAFETYKNKQKNKIKSVNKKLYQTKQELIKNKKQLQTIKKNETYVKHQLQQTKQKLLKKRKELLTIEKKVSTMTENRPTIVLEDSNIKQNPIQKERITYIKEPIFPQNSNISWVEVVVEDDINIYELALKFYGDENKYQEIYTANQQLIGDNYQIYNGMSLKIPITSQFEEQPMILNRD